MSGCTHGSQAQLQMPIQRKYSEQVYLATIVDTMTVLTKQKMRAYTSNFVPFSMLVPPSMQIIG